MWVTGGGAFGRWLGHEDGHFKTGMSGLIKIGVGSPSFCSVKTQEMPTISKPGRGFSLDSKSANALIMDFPSFKTVR